MEDELFAQQQALDLQTGQNVTGVQENTDLSFLNSLGFKLEKNEPKPWKKSLVSRGVSGFMNKIVNNSKTLLRRGGSKTS